MLPGRSKHGSRCFPLLRRGDAEERGSCPRVGRVGEGGEGGQRLVRRKYWRCLIEEIRQSQVVMRLPY